MEPLSNLLPKFALPILDEPLLSLTLRSLRSNHCLRKIILISRDQATDSAINNIIKKIRVDWPFRLIRGHPNFFYSLRLALNRTTTDYVAILMPDVYFPTNPNVRLDALISNMTSNIMIGVGYGRFDEETRHTDIVTSEDGIVMAITPSSERVSNMRSAGRYIFSRDALHASIVEAELLEKSGKVEEVLQVLLKKNYTIRTFFSGEFTNINTPLELLRVNLSTIKRRGLTRFISCSSYVIDSKVETSVISSDCYVEKSSIKRSLLIPRADIRDTLVEDSIAYSEGRTIKVR